MLLAMKTRNQKLVRFDPSIVTVKQSSIVSQIVILSWLVLLDLVNKLSALVTVGYDLVAFVLS